MRTHGVDSSKIRSQVKRNISGVTKQILFLNYQNFYFIRIYLLIHYKFISCLHVSNSIQKLIFCILISNCTNLCQIEKDFECISVLNGLDLSWNQLLFSDSNILFLKEKIIYLLCSLYCPNMTFKLTVSHFNFSICMGVFCHVR